MSNFIFNIPLQFKLEKNKHFTLSFRRYSSCNYYTRKCIKKQINKILKPLIKELPQFEWVQIIYEIQTPLDWNRETTPLSAYSVVIDDLISNLLFTQQRIKNYTDIRFTATKNSTNLAGRKLSCTVRISGKER